MCGWSSPGHPMLGHGCTSWSCTILQFLFPQIPRRKTDRFLPAITAVRAMAFAPSASDAYLTNGDLETLDAGTPVFTGWSNNAGTSIATQAIEGNYSARIERETANNGNALNQNFNDPDGDLSVFRISLDFAASDPGSSTS